MWVVIGLALGLAIVGALLVAVLITRHKYKATPQRASEISGDQMLSLGVIFTGAGVALTASLGPPMIVMIALGIIYMVMGSRMKRRESGR
jgi:hypothetical protein